MDKPLWGGRGRDLGGACPYSRRGLRLRRRGAYGIHRASGPWCQGLCRKVASHRENDSLHFVRRSAPSKCVRCASLRSGGRRLAVRKTIEYQIGALPCTPFPAVREFAPVGSMSLDSRVAGLPYESSSFATPASGGTITRAYCRAIYEENVSRCFILPP